MAYSPQRVVDTRTLVVDALKLDPSIQQVLVSGKFKKSAADCSGLAGAAASFDMAGKASNARFVSRSTRPVPAGLGAGPRARAARNRFRSSFLVAQTLLGVD